MPFKTNPPGRFLVGNIRKDGYQEGRIDTIERAVAEFYRAVGEPDVVAAGIYDAADDFHHLTIATWSSEQGVMRSPSHPLARLVEQQNYTGESEKRG